MLNRKRITNACHQCQQRKRRCDGGKPCCNHCAKHSRDCVYTARRQRGPGKNKEVSVHPMQQLIHNNLSSGLASTARLLEINIQRSYNEVHSGRTTQDSSEEQTTPRYTAMDDPAQGPWTTDETAQTLPAAAKKFAAFAADVHATMKQMQTRVDLGCSGRKVFACLPPKQHTVCLLQPVIEEIQLHGVFLEEEIVLHQLDEQYIAGLDDSDSDPCRWMTVCSLLALSALHRTDNRSLTAISSIAWAFFKNAFAMYAELVARRPVIASCETLLVMALFMLRTADAGLAAQLTAAAAHMAHMLGLQKQEYYIGLDAEVAERHKRIFWAVYILNADVTHRYGLPSPLDEESIVIELPEVEHCHVFSHVDHMARLSRQQKGGILRQQAVFAVAKLRIHKLLERVSFRRLSMQEITDLLEAVTKIHQELEEWKCFMPIETQPSSRAYGTPRLEMPVAMLHYTHLSCISKTSMVAAVLLDLATWNPDMQEVQPPASNKTFSTSRIARARCAMAARGTLDVLLRLQPQPFTHLWQTLCFPLSAILVLLSETLAYPASAHAETDVELIHNFVRYLERLKSEGCEVHQLIESCRRFWSIATCALIASQTDQEVTVFEQRRESICSKFAQVVDWLQLAEGLLSNVPMLSGKAHKLFCDILDLGRPDEQYGDFVPEILKPSNYNFSLSN